MAGEGQLAAGGEDPDPVVGSGIGRRQHEGRLAEVRPTGEGSHGGVVDAVGVEHDGHGVAEVGLGGEDVDLGEAAHGSTVGPAGSIAPGIAGGRVAATRRSRAGRVGPVRERLTQL